MNARGRGVTKHFEGSASVLTEWIVDRFRALLAWHNSVKVYTLLQIGMPT